MLRKMAVMNRDGMCLRKICKLRPCFVRLSCPPMYDNDPRLAQAQEKEKGWPWLHEQKERGRKIGKGST